MRHVLMILLAVFIFVGCNGAGDEYESADTRVAPFSGLSDEYIVVNGEVTGLNEGVYPFLADSKSRIKRPLYGYKNIYGEIVIEPKFTEADVFSEGLAYVTEGNNPGGYIDITGKYIIPPVFNYGYRFYNGKAVISPGDGEGHNVINKKGELLLPPDKSRSITYDSVTMKYICQKEGQADVLNDDLILEKTYQCSLCELSFDGGKTYFKFCDISGKPGMLEYDSGKVIVPPGVGSSYPRYYRGVFVTTGVDNRFLYVYGQNGDLIASFESNSIGLIPLSEDRLYVHDQREHYILEAGVKTQADYWMNGWLTETLIEVQDNDSAEIGAINLNGNIVIPLEFERSWSHRYYDDDLGFNGAIVTKDGEIYAFDQNGVFMRQFTGTPRDYSGYDICTLIYTDPSGVDYVLDKNLEVFMTINSRFEYISVFKSQDSLMVMNMDGEAYSIIDKNGDSSQTPAYQPMEPVLEVGLLDFNKIAIDATKNS